MGTSTEELSTNIGDTRQSLAADLDALQDKVSPSAIVGRQKDAARSRISSVRGKVMGAAPSLPSPSDAAGSAKGSAQDAVGSAHDALDGSPLAAGLIAFGAGLLVAGLFPASQAETRATQKVIDNAQPLVDQAKSAGQEVGDHLKEAATDAAAQVKDSAQSSVETIKDEGASSAQTVKDQAPGQ